MFNCPGLMQFIPSPVNIFRLCLPEIMTALTCNPLSFGIDWRLADAV